MFTKETIMKTKIIFSSLLLGACYSLSIPAFAQTNTPAQSATEVATNDANQQRNQDILTQEKQQKKDTKAAAKETRRINNDAADAARQSWRAFNA